MSADDDLDVLVADLVGVLRELERDLEPETVGGVPRPPTPRELARFTSEVAIPGAILVLRANIEALRLLQRTLRLAEGRSEDRASIAPVVGDRARSLSRATLSRLEVALADLQDALEGRPEDSETRELLGRARALRDEIDERLAASEAAVEARDRDDVLDGDEVPVDVEAELRSIKRSVGSGARSDEIDRNEADGNETRGNEGPGSDAPGNEDDAGTGSDISDGDADASDGESDEPVEGDGSS